MGIDDLHNWFNNQVKVTYPKKILNQYLYLYVKYKCRQIQETCNTHELYVKVEWIILKHY
jgi:hypothetical protein